MRVIPVQKNPKNNFAVARLHYSADPVKADPRWAVETKKGMPEAGWQREYEIDYSLYAGKPVFQEFKYELNVRPLIVPPRSILYVGYDFGYHRPAVGISRINEFDQWEWIKAIIGKDEGIEAFGTRVLRFMMAEYPGCKYIYASDPAGYQKTDKAEKTSIEVLESLGIYPVSRASPINEGIEIIRQKLLMRDDGKVGLLVNSTEEDLIDGFKGGYRYPEAREGAGEKEEPLKDGYFEHIFDSFRYIAINFFSLVETGKQQSNEITQSESTQQDMTRNVIPEGEGIAELF